MERLERLVVHVEEAMRNASQAGDAHQRIALVLLDGAAELMMHRECEDLLARERYDFRQIEGLENAQRLWPQYRTPEMDEVLDGLRAKVTSKTRRRKISRDFHAKTKFLTEQHSLEDAQARVLRRLHEYRNEAYHRDALRQETLASAVKIYVYLVCTMMQRNTPGTIIGGTDLSHRPGLLCYQDLLDPRDIFV